MLQNPSLFTTQEITSILLLTNKYILILHVLTAMAQGIPTGKPVLRDPPPSVLGPRRFSLPLTF
jgi:hypothetical protein